MEFLTVGNSKIKIMLTRDEARKRGIKADGADYADPQTRRSLKMIMDEARIRADFDVGKEKLLIQLYPSGDDGVELLVTKLGLISKENASMISRSENVAVLSEERVYCVFEKFEDLIAPLRGLEDGLTDDSILYRLDGGEYLLSYCEREGVGGVSVALRLCEFGYKINDLSAAALTEHAVVLRRGDAVEFLSRM